MNIQTIRAEWGTLCHILDLPDDTVLHAVNIKQNGLMEFYVDHPDFEHGDILEGEVHQKLVIDRVEWRAR